MSAAIDRPTEDDYFANDDASGALMHALSRTAKPERRSEYLHALAGYEWRRSELHTAIFGEDPHNHDGSPAAVWLADSARLLWILADAEAGRARMEAFAHEPDEREKELRKAAAIPLFLWALGARRRRQLLSQMISVWVEITPGQAAESVACVPFPRWFR